MKLFRLKGTWKYRFVEGNDVYPLSSPTTPKHDEEKFAEVKGSYASNHISNYKGEEWEEITDG